jgi:uncharacterized protein (DUF608 family)
MKNYNEKAGAVRFLLGGIGTGNISLDQNARLCDFELWNNPNKGFRSPYTFFAVRLQEPDGKVHAKILESQLAGPFTQAHGTPDMAGLSRFKHSQMSGDLPFAHYAFSDDSIPIKAELDAFSPFIPLNTDDSSLPVAALRYSITNTSETPLSVSVAGSLCNLSGYKEKRIPLAKEYEPCINKIIKNENFNGIHFLPDGKTEEDSDYFEMSLLTTEKENVSRLDLWYQGAWVDGLQDFWNDFTSDGELTSGRKLDYVGNKLVNNNTPVGSLCVKKQIEPGQKAVFEFIISWYYPNRMNSWYECDESPLFIKNYYAKFGAALESASYFIKNLKRLKEESGKFVNAVKGGSLPDYVSEALLATLAVIRSNTCFRIEDGTFYGWEGCNDNWGCCEGNCSHVWNYTQAIAFLFPELERSMRKTEFLRETDEDGRQHFRARIDKNDPPHGLYPAVDGQMGTIIRLYRDWKLCGDDSFLKELWPPAKTALEYAFTYWDKDGDGLLDGQQHNTYDIEFYGVTSMLNSIFFAALRAGEEISAYLGDNESAAKYKEIREKGAKKLDALCFNGEYYEQKSDDINKYKYQYGKGCLSDQLLGQQLAHVSGLGYILNKDNVKSAVKSIYKYCYMSSFENFNNVQRTYAINDDGGLLLCSWPKGERPEIPFVYSDEVWTGIEYQAASHLIYEGYVDEGLKIVETCRKRYDGFKRNPWDEIECGHHYARSLASFAVLLALTGFRCDAVNKILYFKPALHQDNFTGFFCCSAGWGLYHQKKTPQGYEGKIETLYGNLDGYKIVSG